MSTYVAPAGIRIGRVERSARAVSGYGTKRHDRRSDAPKLFEGFSKRELQDFLAITYYASEAESDDAILRVLHLLRPLLPGQSLIAGLVHVDQSDCTPQFTKILNVSYHPDWIDRYLKNGYADVDPVLLTHVKTFRATFWSNSFKTARSEKEKEFVEEARGFGLATGITAGAFDSHRRVGSFFSFAGGVTADNARYLAVLDLISHYLHHALLKTVSAIAGSKAGLSDREMTVLTWIKNGKTNWEISRILGVSERTVRFHVESIFNKLDATSRTQAVALAIEQGLLRVA